MADDDKSGRRKDGKPYKPGNTRADGSYIDGKYRPPVEHRFAVGDGRKRGRRPKGSRNVLTDWREELDSKVELSEGGKRRKVTKQRALIKAQLSRGMHKSDRAAEVAMRYAELSAKRDPGLQADDFEIIEAWLAGMRCAEGGDDADHAPGGGSGQRDGGGDDASDDDGHG